MNFIVTLLLLMLILGIIITIHEFGHFITAKKIGVYVSEFSIGMGPVIFKKKPKKSETTYSLRLLPIGGYVAMADREIEDLKIKKDKILCNKKAWQKLLVLFAGIIMNFILAFVIFFTSGLIYGRPINDTTIGTVLDESPAQLSGLEVGDKIISINDVEVSNWTDISLELSAKEGKNEYIFKVQKSNGVISEYEIIPNIEKSDDTEKRVFGIGSQTTKYERGLKNAFIYSYEGTRDNCKSILRVVGSLFNGQISLDNLSGPVGIFSVVDSLKKQGLQPILFLIGYLSINVAIINLIPIPVFDGGRILLVIIECITRKKTNEKVENILNYVGFAIMILLMIYVTWNDILNLIK